MFIRPFVFSVLAKEWTSTSVRVLDGLICANLHVCAFVALGCSAVDDAHQHLLNK